MAQVQTVTATDDSPDEVVNAMHTLYSDSGIVKFEITATRMEKFTGDEDLTIFTDGFEVNFFKEKGVIEAHLEAENGEMRPNEKLIIARNNVIFTNYLEGQTLKTEELRWLQATKRIVTEKPFQVFGEDRFYAAGTGLESNETFSDYEMHKVTVEKYIEDEEQ